MEDMEPDKINPKIRSFSEFLHALHDLQGEPFLGCSVTLNRCHACAFGLVS
jgi:hypothetical protein